MDNEKCYFFFSGYHMTASASNVLNRYNIPNRIVRAPVTMRNSCNFALLVAAEDVAISNCVFETERIHIDKTEIVKTRC